MQVAEGRLASETCGTPKSQAAIHIKIANRSMALESWCRAGSADLTAKTEVHPPLSARHRHETQMTTTRVIAR
jgi:hypothetical protein